MGGSRSGVADPPGTVALGAVGAGAGRLHRRSGRDRQIPSGPRVPAPPGAGEVDVDRRPLYLARPGHGLFAPDRTAEKLSLAMEETSGDAPTSARLEAGNRGTWHRTLGTRARVLMPPGAGRGSVVRGEDGPAAAQDPAVRGASGRSDRRLGAPPTGGGGRGPPLDGPALRGVSPGWQRSFPSIRSCSS